MATAEEILEAVRELHKPVPWSAGWGEAGYADCLGCDPGGYAESNASWPCSTADLVYSSDEIKAFGSGDS